MADQQNPVFSGPETVTVTSTQGGQAGGGGGGGGSVPATQTQEKKPAQQGMTLAELVAANLAVLGTTKSPLLEEAKSPTIIQAAPAGNSSLVLIVVLVAIGLLVWYMKRKGNL